MHPAVLYCVCEPYLFFPILQQDRFQFQLGICKTLPSLAFSSLALRQRENRLFTFFTKTLMAYPLTSRLDLHKLKLTLYFSFSDAHMQMYSDKEKAVPYHLIQILKHQCLQEA